VKLSDFVFDFLYEKGVKSAFMLSGGGIMHLVDSLGNSKIKYVCCHHEQAASIAAQANSMYGDTLGCCLVTTGPGGTNALTGAAAAYVDSTPVIFLSGQVKRSDFASLRNVRQFGAQENDIISMAKPVMKHAVLLDNPDKVLYELEKCAYYAMNGRKGPVWLDIPLDVQAAEINPEELEHFSPDDASESMIEPREVDNTIKLLEKAKRPVILVGQGVKAATNNQILKDIIKKYNIPTMATWRALDFLGTDDPLFFGSPGLQAPRYSNLIIQHADLLIVLGSRLDNMITAFNEEHFAFRAQKVIVDIDENEIKKLSMSNVNPIVGDVGDFINILDKKLKTRSLSADYMPWVKRCQKIKEEFPILAEKQEKDSGVNLYHVTNEVSKHVSADATIVISSTSRCNTAGHIAFNHKQGQKTISSMGMGSMGFALPSAVGAYFANGNKQVIVFEGDGSFQLNIQELETIVSNGVDAKMFIFDNRGYAAITTMQERNFDGHYVGSNEKSGLFMPDTEKIANAYSIPFFEIKTEEDIAEAVENTLNTEGPVICKIVGALSFDEIPKCISRIDENTKKRVSAFLENPYPFLPEEELNKISEYLLSE